MKFAFAFANWIAKEPTPPEPARNVNKAIEPSNCAHKKIKDIKRTMLRKRMRLLRLQRGHCQQYFRFRQWLRLFRLFRF